MEKKEKAEFLDGVIDDLLNDFNKKMEENEMQDLKIIKLEIGMDSFNVVCPKGTHPVPIIDKRTGKRIGTRCDPDD